MNDPVIVNAIDEAMLKLREASKSLHDAAYQADLFDKRVMSRIEKIAAECHEISYELIRRRQESITENVVPTFADFIMLEGVREENMYVYKVTARDPDQNLRKLIEYIGKNGNTGHSFQIVVDPDGDKDERKTFYWDGDGADYVHNVEVLREPVK